jgi:Fic family protein
VLVAHTCNLATQEAEIRRIAVQSQLWQIVRETLSQKKKKNHKKGLVEWLKVQALSSNPNPAKKKKNEVAGVTNGQCDSQNVK